MKCPSCGSPVKEGRFCNYCGAKLPDDTTRVEVNVNQRIEDVAEIKRAELESVESQLRLKHEEERLKAKLTKRKACIVLAVVLSLIAIIGIIVKSDGSIKAASGSAMILAFMMIAYIVYQMISGKW